MDPHDEQLYRRISLILNAGFALAGALMLAGMLTALFSGDRIGEQTGSLSEIVPAALRLEATGLVDLGIVVLLATPVAYVVAALATFLRERDRVFVLVTVALLLIMGTTVGLALR